MPSPPLSSAQSSVATSQPTETVVSDSPTTEDEECLLDGSTILVHADGGANTSTRSAEESQLLETLPAPTPEPQ